MPETPIATILPVPNANTLVPVAVLEKVPAVTVKLPVLKVPALKLNCLVDPIVNAS